MTNDDRTRLYTSKLRPPRTIRLGEHLVERGLIDRRQLFEGLAVHQRHGVRLGDALVWLGHIERDQLEISAAGLTPPCPQVPTTAHVANSAHVTPRRLPPPTMAVAPSGAAQPQREGASPTVTLERGHIERAPRRPRTDFDETRQLRTRSSNKGPSSASPSSRPSRLRG